MYRLTAIYDIELSTWLRIKHSRDDLRYNAKIEEFEIEVDLIRNGGASTTLAGETIPIRSVEKIRLSVSRNEDSEPPEIPINDAGGRDLTNRSQWFGERKGAFHRIAVLATNRLIKFFKYKMKAPGLYFTNERDNCFKNPNWADEHGQPLNSGIVCLTGTVIAGFGPELLGEKNFTADHDSDLETTLNNDLEVKIYQEFLSDSRTSIRSNEIDRAVLEMAIACEVAVKEAFFGRTTTSGATFEYLEDQGQVHIRVINLLNKVARHVFSESFKEAESDAYQDIDHLFRCRNKVAHRGGHIFKDDAGIEHDPDRRILESWIASVDTLIAWLESRVHFKSSSKTS